VKKVADFLSSPFPLLDDIRSRLFLIVFCGVFATFFIHFYNPFNLNQVNYESAVGRFLSIWTAGLIGAVILSFTQLVLRRIIKLGTFTLGPFLLWILFEFTCLILAFYLIFGEPHIPFVQEFMLIGRFTVSVGILPYLLACLILAVLHLSRSVRQKEKTVLNIKQWFKDENGKAKLALAADQILLLKSEDNYTSIYYLQNQKIEKTLIRNTLKNLEAELSHPGMIRIHRSYMVNLQKVVSVQKTKRGFELKMDQLPEMPLSVSESYKQLFTSRLQNEESDDPIHPK
jgi:hypothetical protein